ncbi:malate synthase A, partial [Roseiarcus sp.]|uniref:malate synthase A n=1 Tax=Roseiarcus sp. TaxID=1969460 RepID=UPI003C4F75A4
MTAHPAAAGVQVHAKPGARQAEILNREALTFLADLHRRFDGRRLELLAERKERQKLFDAGKLPGFLSETKSVRDGDWKVAPIPADLLDRRVEITGPVDRKMIINALNSGAKVFMADFEDASSPMFANMVEGQANLKDRWAGAIGFTDPATGKAYALKGSPAALMVRPRGWHLPERHVTVDGREMSGSLFDFGLYVFLSAKTQMAQGSTPAFYLPKLENHLEARLWNDVFSHAEHELGVANGSLKATVLIETLPAAFEMDEILYELRDHSAGLNCGRWDYIFSFIKKFRNHASRVLPDRGVVTMQQPFLRSYVELLIHTCHRRGIHAMGGMAAQIPIRNNPKANEEAMERVRHDKLREVRAGHDGTWVAHPGLVPIAKQIFDEHMPQPNQIAPPASPTSPIAEANLLELPTGAITEGGLRRNIDVGLQYLESWLRGTGCVPIYDLMEDAATAEISRSQIWQWLRYNAKMDDGRAITSEMFDTILQEVVA